MIRCASYAIALSVAATFATDANAQAGGPFSVTWQSHKGGGSTELSGGAFEVSGAAGAHDASGGLAGGTFEHDGGFATGMCGSTFQSYGVGCPGSGGFVPELQISGCASAGDQEVFSIKNGLGGSVWFLMIGIGQGAAPIGGGCLLNIAAPFPGIIGPFPLPGAGPGNGEITFQLTVSPSLVSSIGFSATHQMFIADPGNPLGFVATNGVEVTVG